MKKNHHLQTAKQIAQIVCACKAEKTVINGRCFLRIWCRNCQVSHKAAKLLIWQNLQLHNSVIPQRKKKRKKKAKTLCWEDSIQQKLPYARFVYWPVRVSTKISSPVFTNNGTFMTAPVSRVAGFDPPAICILFTQTLDILLTWSLICK